MPKMTQAQLAKHEKLRAKLNAAQNHVYAAAPNSNTVFSECFKMATQEVRDAHEAARGALMAFEHEMVDAGRAWFATFGMFTPNWR